MYIRRTFFTTIALFTVVWGFSAVDTYLIQGRKQREPLEAKATVGKGKIEWSDSVLEEKYAVVVRRLPLGDAPRGSVQSMQVAEIDQQIEELEQMKKGFEARALRHEDQAQRLQFEDRAVLETRRHNELAEENRAKAQKVQEEIDRLQAEKQKLLQSG